MLVALSVIITFGVCWWPYILDFERLTQVVERLFPFNRGLYEVIINQNQFYKIFNYNYHKFNSFIYNLC